MSPELSGAIQAVAAVGSFFVTVIGLYAVYVQIIKLREAIWGETHSNLNEQSLELIRFLAEKPETYDYFYGNKELEEDSPNRIWMLYAAEAVTNFLEHLALQKQNLPASQWATWHRFICITYEKSPVVRRFIKEHRDWYADELEVIVDEYEKQLSLGLVKTPNRE